MNFILYPAIEENNNKKNGKNKHNAYLTLLELVMLKSITNKNNNESIKINNAVYAKIILKVTSALHGFLF